MQIRSIRLRLSAVFSAAIALFMFLGCYGLYVFARYTAQEKADRTLREAARNYSHEYSEHPNLSAPVTKVLKHFPNDNLTMSALDSSGHIMRSMPHGILTWPLAVQTDWRTITFQAGRDTAIIGIPWKATEAQLRYHGMILLLFGAFGTIIATMGAWLLVGKTLSPIALLSNQARTASVDSLQIRLLPPSDDSEIIALVETLNGLLGRLSDTVHARGRFYSAASHELRTPLQALSGHLELAQCRDRTNDEYKETIAEAYQQTQRLMLLSKNLLLLYQLDSSSPLPQETGDLASVCRYALAQYQPLMEDRELTVKVDMPPQAPCNSLPTHIDVLVRNLVENAVKYANPGTEITLTVAANANRTKLELFNLCAPNPEWDTERLFEPFARLDSSRNSHSGGTGLGLAICKAIASANQWELTLAQESEGVRALVVMCALVGQDNAERCHCGKALATKRLLAPR